MLTRVEQSAIRVQSLIQGNEIHGYKINQQFENHRWMKSENRWGIQVYRDMDIILNKVYIYVCVYIIMFNLTILLS